MNECIEMAYDNSIDIDDTIGNLYNGLENVNKFFKRNQRTKNWKDLVDISKENARERERKSQQGLILGVPTPLTKLNKVTNGWANTNLIIIAGRTSCGKTSFALQSCRVASFENNIPSGIISLEQSAEELTDRLVCSEGNIESNKYNRGQLTEYDWKSIDKTKEKIENAPLYIDDRSFNLNDIKLKIKEWVSKGVRLVIIDYLQLVRLKNKEKGMTRESEVSTISRELKLTAKEMNIPIIALSQINRGIEQRRNDDKRPKLSDLRESGSIEQDADMVIFSHIPHKMGIKTIGDNEDSKNRGELIIAKFRNGPICIIEFMHNDDFTQFNDIFKDTAEKTEDNVEQKLDF